MKLLKKQTLADISGTKIVKLEILSPDIAKKTLPGQFIALMISEKGERIPLTIVNKNTDTGSITLICQELGFTSRMLGKMNAGDSLYSIVGPPGHSSKIKKYGKVILAGGGVGIAEIYPVARALKAAGNHVTAILGARTKGLLILEDELRAESDSSGRRRPIAIPGKRFEMDCDMAVIAIGLMANQVLTRVTPQLKTDKYSDLEVNKETMETSIDNVYAGGGIVGGEGTVIEALGMAKKASKAIIERLLNK